MGYNGYSSEYVQMYNDMIDDITGTIKIGNLDWPASYVLKELDKLAYDIGLDEFIDGFKDDWEERAHEVDLE